MDYRTIDLYPWSHSLWSIVPGAPGRYPCAPRQPSCKFAGRITCKTVTRKNVCANLENLENLAKLANLGNLAEAWSGERVRAKLDKLIKLEELEILK
jgi:hypothetical protein